MVEELIKRLLAERPQGMLSGCTDCVELINPDGPYAVAAIADAQEKIEALTFERNFHRESAELANERIAELTRERDELAEALGTAANNLDWAKRLIDCADSRDVIDNDIRRIRTTLAKLDGKVQP
jgi:chromosome segregation ATPase